MIIIQGEDTHNSYKRLSELLDEQRRLGTDPLIKDSQELDLASLRQNTEVGDLFGNTNCLVIKNLLSGSKSKIKEQLIDAIKKIPDSNLVLYEAKKITEAVLKQFPKAKIESFNVNPVIFKFMDVLRPGNTRQIITGWNRLLELNHEAEYVYAMVVRQIRLLIQAKSGASYLKLSPYPKKLIVSQAERYDLHHLIDLHQSLYAMDKRVKTGLSPVPLEQLLTQFFYSI